MASYTDIIPKFNPYIDQIPVETMIEVGMEKQRRYEEGVQKVQTYLDSLAGLDVVRPVDKAYLQSKFNELGNNLKSVAGGDFSNFQLVNSVGGMAKQLVNDPYILNAVSSTKLYRKSLEEIDTARKEGKSGPSNEWDFRKQASNWLDSNELGASFSGRYTPFFDWKKEAIEVFKALKPDVTITDDAFDIDEKGNLVITDAIIREKFTGISPKQIQQALLTGLTPSAFKQMEIDGRYNYSNVTPEQFVQDVNSQYSEKVQHYIDQIKVLDAAKYQTTSTAQKTLLDEKIAQVRQAIESTKNEYAGISKSFVSGDVESAKARLQTINNLTNFSNVFSYTETSKTYENSPFVQAQQFRDTKEWEREKFEEEKRQFKAKQDLEQMKLDLELAKTGMGGKGGVVGGATAEEIGAYDMETFAAKIAADEELLKNSTSILNRPEYKGKDAAWLTDQEKAWERNPKAVDPILAQYFNGQANLKRSIESNKKAQLEVVNQVNSEMGTLEDLIGERASRNTTYQGQVYTPIEIAKAVQKLYKYIKSTGGIANVENSFMGYGAQAVKDSKIFTDKEYQLMELYSRVSRPGGSAENTAEDIAFSQVKDLVQNVVNPYMSQLEARTKRTSELLAERLMGSQAVTYTIDTYKPELRQNLSGLLNALADLADKQTGGLANSPNFSSSTARELATDPSLIGNIRVIEGNDLQPSKYEVSVTGKDGKNMNFVMTPEQKVSYFGAAFESSPEMRAIKPYMQALAKAGGQSTALAPGPTTPNNSYLTSIDFPSVDIYGVKGNIIQSGGLYGIKLTVFNPLIKGWLNDISYPRGGLMQKEKIAAAMANLNDAAIFELLYDIPPTAADLQGLKKASNIPLP